MSYKKCHKVKNPCKFCLQQVTNKNGLQCQGACKKWAHFKCLNYTPGKISDIKAGIIRVTCPCPDCETTQVKEFLANPPYTCSNQECPANIPARCDSFGCPTNIRKKRHQQNIPIPVPQRSPVPIPHRSPAPVAHRSPAPIAKRSPRPVADRSPVPIVDRSSCPNKQCTNEPIECPNTQQSHPRMTPPRPPSPVQHASCPNRQCNKPAIECPNIQQNKKSPQSTPKTKSPPGSPRRRKSPKGKADKKQSHRNEKKWGKKKQQAKKSPSCSMLSSDDSRRPMARSASSDSDLCGPKNQASMVQALQEMCSTVGKLSVQLKELMCRMMQNVQGS